MKPVKYDFVSYINEFPLFKYKQQEYITSVEELMCTDECAEDLKVVLGF